MSKQPSQHMVHKLAAEMLSPLIATPLAAAHLCAVLFAAPAFAAEEATPAAAETADAQGEFVCEADIFYSWRSHHKVAARHPEPISVFAYKISAKGDSEEAAKAALNRLLVQAKADARGVCAAQHEDQAGCISSQLRKNARDFQALDFKSRTAIVDAVKEDCLRQSGTCLEETSEEPLCALYQEKPTATAADEESSGKSGGKAAEKKKKK